MFNDPNSPESKSRNGSHFPRILRSSLECSQRVKSHRQRFPFFFLFLMLSSTISNSSAVSSKRFLPPGFLQADSSLSRNCFRWCSECSPTRHSGNWKSSDCFSSLSSRIPFSLEHSSGALWCCLRRSRVRTSLVR